MIVDPVQSAISAYKDVDGIFRQDRLDKERLDQQKFQNSMATNQDQRAQESHKLQMDQNDRQRKLEGIQSLRYKLSTDPATLSDDDFKLLQQDPRLKSYLEQPDLIVRDLKITGGLHNDVPKLIGVPQLLESATDDTQKQALIKEAKDAKNRIMQGLTILGKDRLVANPENTDGAVQDLLMTPNGLVIEGRFTKKDGKEVIAPLTKGKSSAGDDPVNFYNVKDIMTNITGNAKMLSGLKTALEARGVELGDKTPLARLDKRQERDVDVSRAKDIGTVIEKSREQIDALDWKTDPQGSAAAAYSYFAKQGLTLPEVEHVTKLVIASKTSAEKKLDIKEVGAGNGNVVQAIVNADGTTKPVGLPYPKHAPREGRGGGMDPEDKQNIAARNRAVAYLNTLEVGKMTTDPTTGKQIRVTPETRQAVINTIRNYNGMLSGVAKPYPVTDVPSKDFSVPAAWVQQKREEDKNGGIFRRSRTDEDFKEALLKNYTEEEADSIINMANSSPIRNTTKMSSPPDAPAPQKRSTNAAAITPPAGFKPTNKTVGGKPAFVSADGKKIWTP